MSRARSHAALRSLVEWCSERRRSTTGLVARYKRTTMTPMPTVSIEGRTKSSILSGRSTVVRPTSRSVTARRTSGHAGSEPACRFDSSTPKNDAPTATTSTRPITGSAPPSELRSELPWNQRRSTRRKAKTTPVTITGPKLAAWAIWDAIEIASRTIATSQDRRWPRRTPRDSITRPRPTNAVSTPAVSEIPRGR